MKKILYVDDNAQACLLFKLFLEKEGYKVFTTKETTTARKVLNRERVQAIVSDIGMPGENGLDFYHWLQGQEAYRDIYFLFVSGHAMSVDNRLAGFKEKFVSKPIFFPDLIERLQKALEEI